MVLAFQEKYLELEPEKYRVHSIKMTDETGEAIVSITGTVNEITRREWDEDNKENNYQNLKDYRLEIDKTYPQEWEMILLSTLKNAGTWSLRFTSSDLCSGCWRNIGFNGILIN